MPAGLVCGHVLLLGEQLCTQEGSLIPRTVVGAIEQKMATRAKENDAVAISCTRSRNPWPSSGLCPALFKKRNTGHKPLELRTPSAPPPATATRTAPPLFPRTAPSPSPLNCAPPLFGPHVVRALPFKKKTQSTNRSDCAPPFPPNCASLHLP